MIGLGLEAAFDDVDFRPGLTAVMPDGARLVADVYAPRGSGPWPVLLMRQPYGRDIASTVVYAHPTHFARAGFLVVVQDVRGRGDSDGVFEPFGPAEESDGHATVAWAAGLPGAAPRVGMYGFSYQAWTQLAAAASGAPALRALAPHMGAFDLHQGWFHRDGLLQLSTTLAWGNQMLRADAWRQRSPAAAALEQSWQAPGRLSYALPVREADPVTGPDRPAYVADWLGRRDDTTYWQARDLTRRLDRLGLPMYHLAGWYDFYARGSIAGYEAMAGKHPHQVLHVGPWVHLPWGRQAAGADWGPEAVPDVDARLIAWFRHWLAEDPVGPAPLPPVRAFVLGRQAWAEFDRWPPPAEVEPWFLRSGGRANGLAGDGRLDRGGPGGPSDLFNYDPEVPVAAPGGNVGGAAGFGPFDLSAQQQGLNQLVYTGPAQAEPILLAGQPRLRLHAASSAPATAFVARLSRVRPGGRAEFLSLGARCVAAPAGGPWSGEVDLPFDPLAVELSPGDALRLDLASSAFPLLIRHPNTREDPAAVAGPTGFRRALQVVHHDTARPSALHLPVAHPS